MLYTASICGLIHACPVLSMMCHKESQQGCVRGPSFLQLHLFPPCSDISCGKFWLVGQKRKNWGRKQKDTHKKGDGKTFKWQTEKLTTLGL